jgi:hypothetical protein
MSDDRKAPPADTSWIEMEGRKPSLTDEYFDPSLLDGHGWVKRASKDKRHECSPPQYDGYVPSPMGKVGDLWRCRCGRLWRIGSVWSIGVRINGNGGVRCAWLPAYWWQRIWYRGRP